MKKIIATTLLASTFVTTASTSLAKEVFDTKQSWYNSYIEAQYEKEVMFNLINTINKEYNKDIKYLKPMEFKVSYYTDLDIENGFGAINCLGEPLVDGMVANNILELGTEIYTPELGLKKVADRGSAKYFSDINSIDVFVPRNKGESDSEYYKRVNDMGRTKIQGYILEG